MLSFEHKKSIFKSFQELKEKPISNDRLDYVYSASLQRGRTLATQLHRRGNGYVLGKYIDTSHWEYGNEKYSIYKVTIAHNRIVYMLSTPFFGNGRISYNGIQDAVRHMIKYT